MEWTKESLAKEIGERISGKIICPECSSAPNLLNQELFTVGEMENTIFCPHCELEFEIVIKAFPYTKGKPV